MSGTERVRAGDVLALRRRSVEVDPDREYRLIGIYSFGKGILHRDPQLGVDLGDYKFFDICPGDLVLSNIQSWEGAIAYAEDSDEGTVGTHRFLTYTPVDDRIDTNWAHWFFLSEPGMTLIRQAAPGSTMRNRTLAIKRFEELEIPLPPIDEQRQVARRLDGLRDAAGDVQGALSGSGVGRIIAELPGLVDEVIRNASQGFATISELAEIVSDTVHPGDDPGPADRFVGLQHVQGHTGLQLGSDSLESMKGRKFRFRPGDVVYGYLRPYLNKAWVSDCHGLCSVDQYVLRPRPGVSAEMLGHSLRSRSLLDQAVESTHSLQLPRLRSGLLLAKMVPVVFEPLVAGVVDRLDEIRDLVMEIDARRRHQLELASALVPSGLNELFVGIA